MKNLVIDIDKTLTTGDNKDYNLVSPNLKKEVSTFSESTDSCL